MGRFFLGSLVAGAWSACPSRGWRGVLRSHGGAAGKQVSSGMTKIFGKLDQQTSSAAKTAPEQDTKVAVAKQPISLPATGAWRAQILIERGP